MPATRDLGTKHTCFKCGTKFYDLKKPTPLCPKCGADQREMPPPPKAPRRGPSRSERADEAEPLLDETDEGTDDADEDDTEDEDEDD
jgi:hypothetical protein